MTTTVEVKAALLDEWLKLEGLKVTITSPAGTYHDSATGKFASRPGGAGKRGADDEEQQYRERMATKPKKMGVKMSKLTLGVPVQYWTEVHGWGSGKVSEIVEGRRSPDGNGYVRVDGELMSSKNIVKIGSMR